MQQLFTMHMTIVVFYHADCYTMGGHHTLQFELQWEIAHQINEEKKKIR